MTTKDIIDNISAELNLSKVKTKRYIEILVEIIFEQLDNDNYIIIPGLGKFKTKITKERIGRNPGTGEEIFIPQKIKVNFKANSDILK